jgi:hypothetical protein
MRVRLAFFVQLMPYPAEKVQEFSGDKLCGLQVSVNPTTNWAIFLQNQIYWYKLTLIATVLPIWIVLNPYTTADLEVFVLQTAGCHEIILKNQQEVSS